MDRAQGLGQIQKDPNANIKGMGGGEKKQRNGSEPMLPATQIAGGKRLGLSGFSGQKRRGLRVRVPRLLGTRQLLHPGY